MNKTVAVTVKEISGACISTIPKGTQFEVTNRYRYEIYSLCKGLPINLIWNDEYEFVTGNDFQI